MELADMKALFKEASDQVDNSLGDFVSTEAEAEISSGGEIGSHKKLLNINNVLRTTCDESVIYGDMDIAEECISDYQLFADRLTEATDDINSIDNLILDYTEELNLNS